jgi:glycosyltransferase involved in cell wall biosynthesis
VGNTILYLTDHWPYPPGESFVSNEIRDLAPHFDKIFLLPTTMGPFGKMIREIPENCEVLTDVHEEMLIRWNRKSFLGRLGAGINMKGVMGEVFASRPFAPREVIGEAAQIRIVCDSIENVMGPRFSEIDAVVSFWLNRGALIAAELSRRHRRIVSVSRGHGGDIYAHRRGRKHLPMQRCALKQLKAILPDSDAGVKHIQEMYPEVADRVEIGRLGVDEHDASAPSNDGRLHIISVASLLPVKRIHLIAAALQYTTREIKWTHVGGGETLTQINAELENVGDNVEVDMKGQIDHKDVLKWFEENPADVFINVSSSEGLPVSIMEAFSYGIPAIVTAVGGMPEIVTEECGVLLDSNFKPEELGVVLEQWDLANTDRRDAALAKQRIEYSSIKNELKFALDIGVAILEVAQFAVLLA